MKLGLKVEFNKFGCIKCQTLGIFIKYIQLKRNIFRSD